MIKLSEKWAAALAGQPETGMGYQIVTVTLKDGREFGQVVVHNGEEINEVKGHQRVPFSEDQIARMVVTHDKGAANPPRPPQP